MSRKITDASPILSTFSAAVRDRDTEYPECALLRIDRTLGWQPGSAAVAVGRLSAEHHRIAPPKQCGSEQAATPLTKDDIADGCSPNCIEEIRRAHDDLRVRRSDQPSLRRT